VAAARSLGAGAHILRRTLARIGYDHAPAHSANHQKLPWGRATKIKASFGTGDLDRAVALRIPLCGAKFLRNFAAALIQHSHPGAFAWAEKLIRIRRVGRLARRRQPSNRLGRAPPDVPALSPKIDKERRPHDDDRGEDDQE